MESDAEILSKYPVSLAIGILVPWNATNQEHTANFFIVDADSEETDFRTEVKFNVGRPPMLVSGQTQRVMLAVPLVYVTFQKFGTYVLTVALNGATAKRVIFNVVQSGGPIAATPM